MTDVAANLSAVRQRVAAAATRAGRDPATVALIAVSKLQPAELIRAAYEAGQRDFGENYAAELRDKAEALALPGLRWHAIGALQSNKAKYVARVASAFHAVDRVDVLTENGKRRAGPPIDAYIEVNIADEPTKSGVSPAALGAFYAEACAVPGTHIVGLMCMPPYTEPAEASRPHFRRLAVLARALGLPGLSMGTTDDFEVAIEEGATSVRVGRSIFGERPARG